MSQIARNITGLKFIAPTKENTLNRGQKALLDAIRDCVKNSKTLDWDMIVNLYSANVRDQYQHFYYDFKEGNIYEMVNVLEAYQKLSSVWTMRIRQLVKSWFLHNIGILVMKNELIIVPTIELE